MRDLAEIVGAIIMAIGLIIIPVALTYSIIYNLPDAIKFFLSVFVIIEAIFLFMCAFIIIMNWRN